MMEKEQAVIEAAREMQFDYIRLVGEQIKGAAQKTYDPDAYRRITLGLRSLLACLDKLEKAVCALRTACNGSE